MTLPAERTMTRSEHRLRAGAPGGFPAVRNIPNGASPEETIARVIEEARSEVSCDALAAVYDGRFVTSVNIEVCPFPRCSKGGHLHVTDGPGRYALEHGEPVRIEDTKWSLRWPRWTKRVAAQGFRSVLSIGLRTKRHKYASLMLFNCKPGGFTPHDVARVTLLADDAVLALEAARGERRQLPLRADTDLIAVA